MKHKFSLFIFILLFSFSAFSQRFASSSDGFFNDQFQNAKIADFVDLYTGALNVKIPLFEIKGKNFSIPYYIQYTGGAGIGINQQFSSLGVGWQIVGDDCFKRIVNGEDDFKVLASVGQTPAYMVGYEWQCTPHTGHKNYSQGIGYYHFGRGYKYDKMKFVNIMPNNQIQETMINWTEFLSPFQINGEYFTQTTPTYTTDLSWMWNWGLTADFDPDEYIVNCGDINGSFFMYLDENGVFQYKIKSNNGRSFIVKEPELMINNPVKGTTVSFNDIVSIALVSDNGIEYTFDGRKLLNIKDLNSGEYVDFSRFLIKGQGLRNTSSEIFFQYTDENISRNMSKNDIKTLPNPNYQPINSSNPYFNPKYLFQNLDKIYEYVNRENINYNGTGIPLPKITTSWGEVIDFVFQDSSLVAIRSNVRGGEFVKFNYEENGRVKLSSVSFHDNVYRFGYNTIRLPKYDSNQSDHWGYYNGKDYSNVPFNQLEDFRTVNLNLTQAEILNKITWPYKGYTTFEYENNSYSREATTYPDFNLKNSLGIAGGLRVNNIKQVDGNSDTLETQVKYVYENGISTGILSPHFPYVVDAKFTNFSNSYYLNTKHYISYKQDIFSKCIVGYSAISFETGNSKTIYNMTNYNDYPDEPALGNLISLTGNINRDYTTKNDERGLVKSILYINDKDTIKKEVFLYNNAVSRYDNYITKVSKKFYDKKDVFNYTGTDIGFPFYNISYTKKFLFNPFVRERQNIHYLNNAASMVNSIMYKRNNLDFEVGFESINSKNENVSTITKYSHDFFSSTLDLIVAMQNKNLRNLPIETIIKSGNKVVSAILIEYTIRRGLIVPYKIYKFSSNNSVSDFEPISISSNQWVRDNRYYLESEIINTDQNGNILEVRNNNGSLKVTLWGYGGQYPIAEIKNATYAEVEAVLTKATIDNLNSPNVLEATITTAINKLRTDSRLSKAMVTSYTYKPLVGMTSKTDARGLTEYYEYDGMQRLKAVLDQMKNVTSSMDYHYRPN